MSIPYKTWILMSISHFLTNHYGENEWVAGPTPQYSPNIHKSSG